MQISSRLMAAHWMICGHLGIMCKVENTNCLDSGIRRSCHSCACLPLSHRGRRSEDRGGALHTAPQSTSATSRHRTSQPLVLVCSVGSTLFVAVRCNPHTRPTL